jgi:hypothetical protein
MRTLPGGRPASVRACPRHVRRILDILGLPLDGRPAACPPALRSGTPALVDEVRRARLHAGEAKLDASGTLAELADTRIRLAGTIERAGLVREQGRETLARSRAGRERAFRSRRLGRPGSLPAIQLLTGRQCGPAAETNPWSLAIVMNPIV